MTSLRAEILPLAVVEPGSKRGPVPQTISDFSLLSGSIEELATLEFIQMSLRQIKDADLSKQVVGSRFLRRE